MMPQPDDSAPLANWTIGDSSTYTITVTPEQSAIHYVRQFAPIGSLREIVRNMPFEYLPRETGAFLTTIETLARVYRETRGEDEPLPNPTEGVL